MIFGYIHMGVTDIEFIPLNKTQWKLYDPKIDLVYNGIFCMDRCVFRKLPIAVHPLFKYPAIRIFHS